MNIKIITRETIPCWYELSWQAKPPALILRIHRDFLKGMNINLQKAPIIKSYLKEFAFVEFSCDFERDIGVLCSRWRNQDDHGVRITQRLTGPERYVVPDGDLVFREPWREPFTAKELRQTAGEVPVFL